MLPLGRRQNKHEEIPSHKLEKKFHPYNKGGLAIKDPAKMNIYLGAKLAWRLTMGKQDWWKIALLKK